MGADDQDVGRVGGARFLGDDVPGDKRAFEGEGFDPDLVEARGPERFVDEFSGRFTTGCREVASPEILERLDVRPEAFLPNPCSDEIDQRIPDREGGPGAPDGSHGRAEEGEQGHRRKRLPGEPGGERIGRPARFGPEDRGPRFHGDGGPERPKGLDIARLAEGDEKIFPVFRLPVEDLDLEIVRPEQPAFFRARQGEVTCIEFLSDVDLEAPDDVPGRPVLGDPDQTGARARSPGGQEA